MSMPSFPKIDSEMTRERALDMILTSIAMEELALSHIINAESEKIQYALGTLEKCSGKPLDIDKILCVNQSVSGILEMVSQNQMLLKNKLSKVLQALPGGCPGPTGPTGPPGPPGPTGTCRLAKCNAVFRGEHDCKIWLAGYGISWNDGSIQGNCIRREPGNHEKILICSKRRYQISFSGNVSLKSACQGYINIVLQVCNGQHYSNIFTFKERIIYKKDVITISISGIIVDTSHHIDTSSLSVKLVSPNKLTIEDSMFNIVEI